MFIANMPTGLAEACYFYENSGIYFRDGMGLNDLKKFAVHEVIHHIQEVKNEKNELVQMGLSNYKNGKGTCIALNEAAVQIVSSCVLETKLETVKYYGIEFSTISPDCYPLICNLLSQMCYIVGEDLLYDSVFYSTDKFKNKFIELCGKNSFNIIKKNFDLLLQLEEKIIILNNKFEDENCPSKKAIKYQSIINIYKNKIKDIFLHTQKIIFTSYFDNQFLRLQSDSDIEVYKTKFTIYKDLIGITDTYSDFSNYYKQKLNDIEQMHTQILSRKFPAKRTQNKLVLFLQSLFNKFRIHLK